MVRFGIAGFGLHAVKRLMPGFVNARNCRVTALSRRDPERARESAREFGIAHAFTSTAELVRVARRGCGLHRHAGCAASCRRAGSRAPQQACAGGEADGNECQRSAPDGRSRASGRCHAGCRSRHALRRERALVSRTRRLGSHRQARIWREPPSSLPWWSARGLGLTIQVSPPEARWPTSAYIASTHCATCWQTKYKR